MHQRINNGGSGGSFSPPGAISPVAAPKQTPSATSNSQTTNPGVGRVVSVLRCLLAARRNVTRYHVNFIWALFVILNTFMSLYVLDHYMPYNAGKHSQNAVFRMRYKTSPRKYFNLQQHQKAESDGEQSLSSIFYNKTNADFGSETISQASLMRWILQSFNDDNSSSNKEQLQQHQDNGIVQSYKLRVQANEEKNKRNMRYSGAPLDSFVAFNSRAMTDSIHMQLHSMLEDDRIAVSRTTEVRRAMAANQHDSSTSSGDTGVAEASSHAATHWRELHNITDVVEAAGYIEMNRQHNGNGGEKSFMMTAQDYYNSYWAIAKSHTTNIADSVLQTWASALSYLMLFDSNEARQLPDAVAGFQKTYGLHAGDAEGNERRSNPDGSLSSEATAYIGVLPSVERYHHGHGTKKNSAPNVDKDNGILSPARQPFKNDTTISSASMTVDALQVFIEGKYSLSNSTLLLGGRMQLISTTTYEVDFPSTSSGSLSLEMKGGDDTPYVYCHAPLTVMPPISDKDGEIKSVRRFSMFHYGTEQKAATPETDHEYSRDEVLQGGYTWTSTSRRRRGLRKEYDAFATTRLSISRSQQQMQEVLSKNSAVSSRVLFASSLFRPFVVCMPPPIVPVLAEATSMSDQDHDTKDSILKKIKRGRFVGGGSTAITSELSDYASTRSRLVNQIKFWLSIPTVPEPLVLNSPGSTVVTTPRRDYDTIAPSALVSLLLGRLNVLGDERKNSVSTTSKVLLYYTAETGVSGSSSSASATLPMMASLLSGVNKQLMDKEENPAAEITGRDSERMKQLSWQLVVASPHEAEHMDALVRAASAAMDITPTSWQRPWGFSDVSTIDLLQRVQNGPFTTVFSSQTQHTGQVLEEKLKEKENLDRMHLYRVAQRYLSHHPGGIGAGGVRSGAGSTLFDAAHAVVSKVFLGDGGGENGKKKQCHAYVYQNSPLTSTDNDEKATAAVSVRRQMSHLWRQQQAEATKRWLFGNSDGDSSASLNGAPLFSSASAQQHNNKPSQKKLSECSTVDNVIARYTQQVSSSDTGTRTVALAVVDTAGQQGAETEVEFAERRMGTMTQVLKTVSRDFTKTDTPQVPHAILLLHPFTPSADSTADKIDAEKKIDAQVTELMSLMNNDVTLQLVGSGSCFDYVLSHLPQDSEPDTEQDEDVLHLLSLNKEPNLRVLFNYLSSATKTTLPCAIWASRGSSAEANSQAQKANVISLDEMRGLQVQMKGWGEPEQRDLELLQAYQHEMRTVARATNGVMGDASIRNNVSGSSGVSKAGGNYGDGSAFLFWAGICLALCVGFVLLRGILKNFTSSGKRRTGTTDNK